MAESKVPVRNVSVEEAVNVLLQAMKNCGGMDRLRKAVEARVPAGAEQARAALVRNSVESFLKVESVPKDPEARKALFERTRASVLTEGFEATVRNDFVNAIDESWLRTKFNEEVAIARKDLQMRRERPRISSKRTHDAKAQREEDGHEKAQALLQNIFKQSRGKQPGVKEVDVGEAGHIGGKGKVSSAGRTVAKGTSYKPDTAAKTHNALHSQRRQPDTAARREVSREVGEKSATARGRPASAAAELPGGIAAKGSKVSLEKPPKHEWRDSRSPAVSQKSRDEGRSSAQISAESQVEKKSSEPHVFGKHSQRNSKDDNTCLEHASKDSSQRSQHNTSEQRISKVSHPDCFHEKDPVPEKVEKAASPLEKSNVLNAPPTVNGKSKDALKKESRAAETGKQPRSAHESTARLDLESGSNRESTVSVNDDRRREATLALAALGGNSPPNKDGAECNGSPTLSKSRVFSKNKAGNGSKGSHLLPQGIPGRSSDRGLDDLRLLAEVVAPSPGPTNVKVDSSQTNTPSSKLGPRPEVGSPRKDSDGCDARVGARNPSQPRPGHRDEEKRPIAQNAQKGAKPLLPLFKKGTGKEAQGPQREPKHRKRVKKSKGSSEDSRQHEKKERRPRPVPAERNKQTPKRPRSDAGEDKFCVPEDYGEQLKVLQAVKDLLKEECTEPFAEPVDPNDEGCATYYDRIKEPMDLGTISRRLEEASPGRAYYLNTLQVMRDLELVWSNCREFNGDFDPVCYEAEKCKNRLGILFEQYDVTCLKNHRGSGRRVRGQRLKRRSEENQQQEVSKRRKKSAGPPNDGSLVGKAVLVFSAFSGKVKSWRTADVVSFDLPTETYVLKWELTGRHTRSASFGLGKMYPVFRQA